MSRRALVALALLTAAFQPAAAQARYQRTGFSLEQLQATAGAGSDPGTADPTARLQWAVETAIPREWRESVSVVWSVGSVTPGHLALSYLDGRTVLSPRVMSRSAEELLSTVAHEMAHQIAFALVSPVLGYPPQQFIDLSTSHNDVRERWADCVARVWTGSDVHTLSELGPCPQDLADFVAGLLADPATLGATARIMPPPERGAEPPAPPAPPPVVVEPQEAVTLPSPVILAASPDPRPRAAAQAPAARYEGLRVALLMVPVPMLLCGAGWWYVRAQGPGTLAWPAAHLKGRSRRQS